MRADELVFVGSPGLGSAVPDQNSLLETGSRLWYGETGADFVSDWTYHFHGADPGSYGAERFSTDGATRHSQYYDEVAGAIGVSGPPRPTRTANSRWSAPGRMAAATAPAGGAAYYPASLLAALRDRRPPHRRGPLRLLDERPAVTRIDTGNAESNEAMLAINVAMGFKPRENSAVWQVSLERARAALSRPPGPSLRRVV